MFHILFVGLIIVGVWFFGTTLIDSESDETGTQTAQQTVQSFLEVLPTSKEELLAQKVLLEAQIEALSQEAIRMKEKGEARFNEIERSLKETKTSYDAVVASLESVQNALDLTQPIDPK